MTSGMEAINKIEVAFPSLVNELREDDGLLHVQIGTWSHLVRDFISNKDQANFNKACVLFWSLFENASPELENALNVSFLEHLDFTENSWAYEVMPKSMKKAWDEMEEYNNQIHGTH